MEVCCDHPSLVRLMSFLFPLISNNRFILESINGCCYSVGYVRGVWIGCDVWATKKCRDHKINKSTVFLCFLRERFLAAAITVQLAR